jgi:hypothetical protein
MTSTGRLLTLLIVAGCAAIAACGDLFGPGRSDLGYPRKVVYDFSRTMVDDEITYDLSGVAPIVTTQRNRR